MSKKHKELPEYTVSPNITEAAIDSHTHLFQQGDYEKIVGKFPENKIEAVINFVESPEDIKRAHQFSSRHKNVFYFAGLHPYSAKNFNSEYEELIIGLSKSDPQFCGVGEIGLDYHFNEESEYYVSPDVQKETFVKQLKLAHSINLPVSLHIRDAHEDTIKILKENRNLLTNSGIIHCFSGTINDINEYLNLGFYISFSGAVTYKKASETMLPMADIIRAVPRDKLLIETDAPYLCPSPYRGKPNEPKYVLLTAQAIADVREMDVNLLISQAKENTKALIKKIP